MSLHIRANYLCDGKALCGNIEGQLSQSILGMRISSIQTWSMPDSNDYCEACWTVYQRCLPALRALLHIPDEPMAIRERLDSVRAVTLPGKEGAT